MSSYDGWLRPAAAEGAYDGRLRPEGPDTGGPVFLDATGGGRASTTTGGVPTIRVTLPGGANATAGAGAGAIVVTRPAPELPPFAAPIETSPGRVPIETSSAGGRPETATPTAAPQTITTGRYF